MKKKVNSTTPIKDITYYYVHCYLQCAMSCWCLLFPTSAKGLNWRRARKEPFNEQKGDLLGKNVSTSKLGGLSLIEDQECWGPTGTTILVCHSILMHGLPTHSTPDGTSMK